MDIKPFRGWRPRADLADRLPSYPYDVISSAEARELAADDPYSFLHVIKPEIDLDPGVDPYADGVYARGRENLQRMIAEGWLVRDAAPAYYVYRLVMDGRAQTGILGAASVADYREGRIKRHEHTRPAKEEDRIRLNLALEAHPGPVMLIYRGLPELNALVHGISAKTPDVSFTAPDGIEHQLWVVPSGAEATRIAELFSRVPATYVADGHHRAAAAARVGERLSGQDREPTRYFLAVHFPSDQLRVFDYNRVVTDLNGLTPEGFLERLRAAGFGIRTPHRERRPPHRESFGMYVDGTWHLLTAPRTEAGASLPVDRLDVAVLARTLLEPILGIGDPRTDPRIDFVGGIRGMDELERRVDSGRDAVAFALHPTSLDDVMQVADAGEVMPPKSTWFEPKLRSGMVLLSLADDRL